MSSRYWIGNSGNWFDTHHWSLSSGGVGGSSVPTTGDSAIFDENSGSGTVTIDMEILCGIFIESEAYYLFSFIVSENGILSLSDDLEYLYGLGVELTGILDTNDYNVSISDWVEFKDSSIVNLRTSTLTIGLNVVDQSSFLCDSTVTLDADESTIILYMSESKMMTEWLVWDYSPSDPMTMDFLTTEIFT